MTEVLVARNRLRSRRLGVMSVLFVAAAILPAGLDGPARAEPSEGSTPVSSDAQRRISAGGLHTCAVLDTGEVQCWGQNANGQLGVSTTASTTVPIKVIGITTALGVSGGSTHTCALIHNSGSSPVTATSGPVRCWGNNGSGQLGNDSTSPPDDPALAPVNVVELTDATAISAGGFHTCALRADGTVQCWGNDGSGQVGDGGALGTSYSPVTVTVDTDSDPAVETLAPLAGATAIASGEYHSCALIGATGAVKCWGHNGFGQLGNGTTATATSAVTVSAIPDDDPHAHPPHKALAISAGQSHTCAVLDDNTARCWGHNFYGQLGNNTTFTLPASAPASERDQGGTDSYTPVTVKYDADGDPLTDPVALGGIISITTGQFHTCAGLSGGSARCWGNNGRGQLGDNTTTNKNKPVVVSGLTGVRAITAGGFHTCALRTGNAMKCWGYNFYGQLGSYNLSSNIPVTVTALSGVTTTATTGDGHACALVVSAEVPSTDKPVCWGSNANGELGANLSPSPANSTIPVPVFGIADAGAVGADPVGYPAPISAGNEHACLLPAGSGTPKCWGRNTDGELGNGNNTSSDLPVNVSGLTTVTQLSAGGELFGAELGHTCAVLTDNTARCWGFNGYGELGNSTTVTSNFPVTVKSDDNDDHLNNPPPAITAPINLAGAIAVAAGGRHSCALMSDGEVRCWGRNFDGQLGDGTTTDRPFAVTVDTDPGEPDPDNDPKRFTELTGITAIAAGARHNCALKNDNTIWCWGRNADGQLGTGNKTPSDVPVKVQGLPLTSTLISIAAGDNHTCARVKDSDNNTTMLCWGDNAFGQLGNGNTGTDSTSPVAPSGLGEPGDDVSNVEIVRGISAGRKNTCAVLIETSVSCWGDNEFRQIGDGVGSLSKTPIDVKDLGSVGGNSIPDANDDTATIAVPPPPALPITINVLANDTDADGNALTVTTVSNPPRGSASTDGSTVTYTPDANFCTADPTSNTDTFTYSVTDGTATVPAKVTVTVNCANTAPDANDDSVTTAEETAVTVTVLDNDSDINGDTMSVSAGSVSNPPHGSAVINPDGTTVKYTPDTNFFGTDTFTYKAWDGTADSAPATVTVNVTNVNDAPVANDDNVVTNEDTAVTVTVVANDTDVDGPSLAISSVGPAGSGSAVAGTPTSITYTPSPNFCGTDSLVYTVSDGSATDNATLTVTVTCANDGPNANDDSGTTNEDTAVVINVLANDTDPEGDPLTVSAVTDPPHGTAVIDPGATSVTYTPDPNFCGVDQFGYTATDGTSSDSAIVVPVNVICNNDPPVANPDSPTTNEDTPIGIEVLANDTDPDGGDVLSVISVTDPPSGAAQIESSGFVTYSPDANTCGSDTFNYTISDGNGATATGTVNVTVTCLNDAPVISPIPNRITPWGEDVIQAVTANDPDTGDSLTYSLVSGPTGATVSPTGEFSWTPSDSQVGVHTITVRATDGTLSDDESFTVTVNKRATFIAYMVATSGQYSDPVVVSALLKDFEGTSVSARTLNFTIGSRSTTAITAGSGLGSGSIVLADPAGLYSVVTGFAGDSAYLASSTSEEFTIKKELVNATFTGTHLTTTSGTSAPVTLKATVAEEADGNLGNGIATLQVKFSDTAGNLLCSSPVSLTEPGQGTASCTTASLALGSRAVVVSVTGASYKGPVDVGVFTIAQLPTGSAAGAGRIGTDDFGFMARPGAKKAPPIGDAIHVFRDGSYAYVVQSSSLTSLSRSCTGGRDKVCTAAIGASGATTIAIELATGIDTPVAGPPSVLKVDATDVAEPSGGTAPPDTYAVHITGGTTYSLGTSALQVLINAGNIRVPS